MAIEPIIGVLSAITTIVGGWAIIAYVFPLLEKFLSSAIKDKKVLHSFMGLLNILILWMVAQGVIIFLIRIDNTYLNYLRIFLPALDVFFGFLPYLKYIILGWFLIIALKKK